MGHQFSLDKGLVSIEEAGAASSAASVEEDTNYKNAVTCVEYIDNGTAFLFF